MHSGAHSTYAIELVLNCAGSVVDIPSQLLVIPLIQVIQVPPIMILLILQVVALLITQTTVLIVHQIVNLPRIEVTRLTLETITTQEIPVSGAMINIILY